MAGFDPMQQVTVGRSVAYSVSRDYASPNPLRQATLEQVTVDFFEANESPQDAVVALGFARD